MSWGGSDDDEDDATAQYRRLLFTYHPPGQPDTPDCATELIIQTTAVQHYVWQWEVGEGGKLHGQGFLQVLKGRRLRLAQVLKMFNHPVHVKKVHKNPNLAREYCMKQNVVDGVRVRSDGRVEGTELHEYGEYLSEKTGRRSDLHDLITHVDSGAPREEILRTCPELSAKYPRFLSELMTARIKKRCHEMEQQEPPEVTCIHGPPGVGKTRSVHAFVTDMFGVNEKYDHLYVVELDSSTIWFDDYTGQEVMLFDDIGPNWFTGTPAPMRPEKMLRLLDRYACRLNVKYGHSFRCVTHIFLTSNMSPACWGFGEHYPALMRRIKTVDSRL